MQGIDVTGGLMTMDLMGLGHLETINAQVLSSNIIKAGLDNYASNLAF